MPSWCPTAASVTCTPVAWPPISMPLPSLPEMMQVRIRLLPPLEVIRMPSRWLGAASPKAKVPPNVLNDVKPLARAGHVDTVLVVARDHVAQRDHAADLRVPRRTRDQQAVAADWPRPWRYWRPTPMKLAWTVVSLELTIRRPLPPLPLRTL